MRVLAVKGHAWVQDDDNLHRYLRLVRGDVLPETDFVRTGTRGMLAFGAPKCHGLRFTLLPHSNADIGSYLRRPHFGAPADVFGSMRARVNRHGGGVGTSYLWIRPLGRRNAVFAVKSRTSTRALIDVEQGDVLVLRSVNKTREPLGKVRRGQSKLIRCSSYRHCWIAR